MGANNTEWTAALASAIEDGDALPKNRKYVLYNDDIYIVSQAGGSQMMPETSPSIGYKVVDSTVPLSLLLKNGEVIDEASALGCLLGPMRRQKEREQEAKKAGISLSSAFQKMQGIAEAKSASPSRLHVAWEKK